MIDIGITGGETLAAGELIRILINHPDVNLRWVSGSPVHARVTQLHRGLVGECDLQLSAPTAEGIDAVLVCSPGEVEHWLAAQEVNPELKVIDVTSSYTTDERFTYGLSEVNRKYMVHDCYRVSVPKPQSQAILPALLPLAKNLLLNSDVEVTLRAGKYCVAHSEEEIGSEVIPVVSSLQTSFGSQVKVNTLKSDGGRDLTARVVTKCGIDMSTIKQIFEDYYDDHNFVFLTGETPVALDVENTCKCLLRLSREGENIVIESALDAVLKGCAGTAVHVMNLLFGLHERVGLMLKASGV